MASYIMTGKVWRNFLQFISLSLVSFVLKGFYRENMAEFLKFSEVEQDVQKYIRDLLKM